MGLSNYLKPIPKALAPSGWTPTISAPPAIAPKPSFSGVAFLKARAEASFEDRHPEEASEIRRVVSLATHYKITKEELEAVCRRELLGDAFDAGFRLHPEQAAILLAYDENSRESSVPFGVGCFGPIGCGRGKTLATQMIAERAYKRGLKRSVILVPAQVVSQFFTPDLQWARTKVPLTVYFHRLSEGDADQRRALVRSHKPGCYVMSYEWFSQESQSTILDEIEPDLIICDEAHKLARRTASRTKRYLRYVEAREPQCVAFSGTMTGKSVKDYWHIIKACLRLKSPLPVAKNLMEEWANVLDSDAEPTKAQSMKLRPLVAWARNYYERCQVCAGTDRQAECKPCGGSGKTDFTEDVAGYRKAFTLRLNSSPGVVSSPEDVVGASLIIANKPVEKPEESEGWPELQELMKKVELDYLTPGNEVIQHAIHKWKWLYELSTGFYNELFWPTPEVLAKRRGLSVESAKDLLERAKKHHAAHQLFSKEMRDWLNDYSRPKLDSPLLVDGFMATKGAPPHGEELYRCWKAVRALKFDGMPIRDSRAVRVCDYKVKAAAKWAKSLDGEGGVIWIHNEEIGEWVVEALLGQGIDAFHAPAGDKVNEQLKHTPENVARNKDKIIVASIKAHGTGKNLQYFWNQYTVQFPRSAKDAEQMIARLHREGQEKDELTVTTSNTTHFDHANFAACLNDALYIHQTGGGRQRVIYARYDPLPRVYTPEWLREHGFQAQMLNKEQKTAMQDKFGAAITA